MPDLLLELFSEEIPARMQRRAADDLKRLVTDGLVAAGLTYEGAVAHATPRRLALDLRGLTAASAASRDERKGPRTDAPQKAIEGFLKGAGLDTPDQAEIRNDPKKGDFYVAVIEKAGRPAEAIIAELIPKIIGDFPWPKSMRWGAGSAQPGSLRWVRPLQSVLCTFGPETEPPVTVDFTIAGIKSGHVTYGHRFHAPEQIKIRRFEDYAARLEKAYVILDADRRRAIIETDARNLSFALGLNIVDDPALLDEVAHLVEWPVVLMGTFDEAFLDIPPEIIRQTIKTNQKCFVTTRAAGGTDNADSPGEQLALSNNFVIVANIEASDGGAEIARGNRKVVEARLSDALYFWRTDQADLADLDIFRAAGEELGLDLSLPLDQRMARLHALNVMFHARLGTQGARVQRIAKLAGHIAGSLNADPDLAQRAGLLAKADLVTEVVGEFPELQGLMGRKYAALQGESEAVAKAIEEHYRPQGPAEPVPEDPVSIAVSLADKLDMLVGFWAIDEKPTGSKDPYALRRAALGIIRTVLERKFHLGLGELTSLAYRNLLAANSSLSAGSGWQADLIRFFHDRLKVQLREEGARHDLVDAVLSGRGGTGEAAIAHDDLLDVAMRIEALGRFLSTADGANLLAGARRAANILSAEEKKGAEIAGDVDPDALSKDEEKALHQAVETVEKSTEQAVEERDYEAAMAALSKLREPVDAFFEAVLVNDPDAAIRDNRLALLARLRRATLQVADFSKIEG